MPIAQTAIAAQNAYGANRARNLSVLESIRSNLQREQLARLEEAGRNDRQTQVLDRGDASREDAQSHDVMMQTERERAAQALAGMENRAAMERLLASIQSNEGIARDNRALAAQQYNDQKKLFSSVGEYTGGLFNLFTNTTEDNLVESVGQARTLLDALNKEDPRVRAQVLALAGPQLSSYFQSASNAEMPRGNPIGGPGGLSSPSATHLPMGAPVAAIRGLYNMLFGERQYDEANTLARDTINRYGTAAQGGVYISPAQ